MNDSILGIILLFGFFFFIFIVPPIFCLIEDKIQKNHELRRLGILKLKSKNIKVETNYNEKIKYQIKFWIINITALIIICIIAKIFGFGIKDIVDLIK